MSENQPIEYKVVKGDGSMTLELANGDRLTFKVILGEVMTAGVNPDGTPRYTVQAQTVMFLRPSNASAKPQGKSQ